MKPAEMIALRQECQVLARRIVKDFAAAGHMVATAESCTGGMIAGAITDIAGSSEVFDRGFVTYSNEAKMEMLGVSEQTLGRYGAVSKNVAREMADGAKTRSRADYAVSVTGIAGPGGGSADKPVGLVHMGLAGPGGLITSIELRWNSDWDRETIRLASVHAALEALLDILHGRAQADGWP